MPVLPWAVPNSDKDYFLIYDWSCIYLVFTSESTAPTPSRSCRRGNGSCSGYGACCSASQACPQPRSRREHATGSLQCDAIDHKHPRQPTKVGILLEKSDRAGWVWSSDDMVCSRSCRSWYSLTSKSLNFKSLFPLQALSTMGSRPIFFSLLSSCPKFHSGRSGKQACPHPKEVWNATKRRGDGETGRRGDGETGL